jgi:hypothetical protein
MRTAFLAEAQQAKRRTSERTGASEGGAAGVADNGCAATPEDTTRLNASPSPATLVRER